MLNVQEILGNISTRWENVSEYDGFVVISKAKAMFYSSCICLALPALFLFFLFILSNEMFWLYVIYGYLFASALAISILVYRENSIVLNKKEKIITFLCKKFFKVNKFKVDVEQIRLYLEERDNNILCLYLKSEKYDMVFNVATSRKYTLLYPILKVFEDNGCEFVDKRVTGN